MNPKWSDLLDDYFTAAKQLDDIGNELKSTFSIHIPVPRKVHDNNNNVKPLEQFSFPIPQILSTMTPKEDSDILIIEPNIKKFHTNINLKHSEKLLIEECNKKFENTLMNFNVIRDRWKMKVKAKKAVMNTNTNANANGIQQTHTHTVALAGKRKREDVDDYFTVQN